MTPAVAAARRARIDHELLEYAHDPRAASYGAEAVAALGLSAATVFKTLIARDERGGWLVACVPVESQVDLKALALAAGARRCEMASPADAERATGYVLGGVSPLGQKKRLPTVIDESALGLEWIHVSAGRRGLEIRLRPADLVRLTAARTAPIARRHP